MWRGQRGAVDTPRARRGVGDAVSCAGLSGAETFICAVWDWALLVFEGKLCKRSMCWLVCRCCKQNICWLVCRCCLQVLEAKHMLACVVEFGRCWFLKASFVSEACAGLFGRMRGLGMRVIGFVGKLCKRSMCCLVW